MQDRYWGNPRRKRDDVESSNWRVPEGVDNTRNRLRQNRSPSAFFNKRSYSGNGIQNQRDSSNSNFNTRRRNEKFESQHKFTTNYRPGRRVGFKALEMLLEKDSEELILELSNLKEGLHDFIKSDFPNDAIVLFIKLLKKVSDSPFVETKYKVLQLYLDEIFLAKLFKYIVLLPTQREVERNRNQYFWNSTDEFWNNLVGICQEIYNSLPTFAYKILPNLLESLLTSFLLFEEKLKQHISDEIKERVTKLNESIQILVKQEEEKNKVSTLKEASNFEGEPPDDFREISVYPTSVELLSSSPGFLRRNIVEGPYNDINHYLDVQFRLLREDFVGPLRSGITTYRSESTQKQRIENVRIYNKVRFLNQETINEQYCIRVQFDFSNNKKKFKYEESKRFMFGSLLCFTCDNFKSFIFGKVAQRELEDLQKGQVIVGFDEQVFINYAKDFLMIECSIYFEPYFHVLNVLQEMDTDNFPMEKYIIRVDPTIQPPQYLTETSKIIVRSIEFFPLLDWPKRNFYNLNESQLSAFKAALTQEFSVIQGPPGTGKTFVGLKIAQTLLENENLWFKRTPMLVICYTNHALDQFLEGLIPFTDRILRIGGQSKNEKLVSFNLRNIKFRSNSAVLEKRNEVKLILQDIKTVKEDLTKADSYGTVFNVFEDYIPKFHETWFYSATSDEVLKWLLADFRDFEENEPTTERSAKSLRIEDENKNDEESDEENENIQNQVDDLFDEVRGMEVRSSKPLITISSLDKEIQLIDSTLRELKQRDVVTPEDILKEDRLTLQLYKLRQRYEYLNNWLDKGYKNKKETPSWDDFKNPHNLAPEERWNLYFYCLGLYKQRLREKLKRLSAKFRENYKDYEQMRDIENTGLMKNVLVVGLTTTGAARLRSSLQSLKSPIVIVEEAAEILEAHIISSLTQHCKHLILIGDHKQLKPSSANYSIEKFYNLGISLFERMVLNKIQLHTLNVQHRMRPEIASLISPTIYPDLENHPSVNERPAIKGVNNCLFFIDHANEEISCEGTTSKKNFHEVDFLIYFARHLILNGYEPENITILAAYLGQMFELQKEKKKHKEVLGNMRIAVLDNYQGEECDIILLSLVRNNKENKIGFLSIENRVCVALSRARDGFYLMGNMNQLCETSEMWRKIRQSFVQQNALGPQLPLRCQIHPEKVTFVSSGRDFLNIAEGGCNQKCDADLVCGHKCTYLCHVLDRKHESYRCLEKCGKKLCDKDDQHLCQKCCYENCGPCCYKVFTTLQCGHVATLECHIDPETYNCEEAVSTVLPCGHKVDKPCYSDPKTFRCPFPCEKQIEPCGHACEKNCHIRQDPDHLQYKCVKKCAKYLKNCQAEGEKHKCIKLCYEECDICLFRVRKERNCSHFYDVPCSSNVNDFPCEKPCKKILACGHKCKNKCEEPCGNCKEKVDKIINTCGHTIKMTCSEEPRKELCSKQCPLKLPCGHPCTTKCRESCTTKCMFDSECAIKSPCGHVVTRVPCYLLKDVSTDPKILLEYCNHPCRDQLQCGHNCSGSCGECSQGRVHKRCSEKCGNPLVCNHPCEFPCREACRPCTRPCPYKCKHSSCGKRCGDVCIPCKEKCPRRCKHQKCNKYCGEICEIPPCEQPCHKKLRCGHLCVGFCGDPCPPKCLICDKEELTEIFFGYEEQEDARYVLLEDCGHIFESTGLKEWMERNGEEIGFKECPKCKTSIKTTHRYSDYVKQAKAEVANVKKKINGNENEINIKRADLIRKLGLFYISIDIVGADTADSESSDEDSNFLEFFEGIFSTIKERLKPFLRDRRQRINKSELNAIEAKLQILEHMINILKKHPHVSQEGYISQVNFIIKILTREEDYITDQEIVDLQYELNRLARIVEFERIKNSSNFSYQLQNKDAVKRCVKQIKDFLFKLGKFVDTDEEKTKQLLKELNDLVASGIGISDQERREIVKAMGFKQGHWFKCPKGHPYCIADCGGAMVISKCPECGSQIGGTNHTLLANNNLASEMDGARFAAWSEAANNMGNYEFNF